MQFSLRTLVLALAACLPIALAGCPSSTPTSEPKAADEHDHDHGEEGHDHDHAHDHAHEGPHGGHIIEIGDEEYHAEWTHDDSGKVTVYILDSTMKKDVPLESQTIAINMKIGEEAKQYTLEADAPMSNKFATENEALVAQLGALSEGVTATLSLDIDGKHYEAPITAGGHDHAHDHKH